MLENSDVVSLKAPTLHYIALAVFSNEITEKNYRRIYDSLNVCAYFDIYIENVPLFSE
jgi:hypothetical protein